MDSGTAAGSVLVNSVGVMRAYGASQSHGSTAVCHIENLPIIMQGAKLVWNSLMGKTESKMIWQVQLVE